MGIADKRYSVEVTSGECHNSPTVEKVSIDKETAKTIRHLAVLCLQNDLQRVEKFDYRARFYQFDPDTDPEDAEDAGEGNEVRTECDFMVVQKRVFYFRSYVKHTDVRVSCTDLDLNELMQHFGLPTVAKEDDWERANGLQSAAAATVTPPAVTAGAATA